MASKEIEKFQQNLIQAVKEGFDGKEKGSVDKQWSLSSSWMYSLTVITTIGECSASFASFASFAILVQMIL